MSFWQSWKGNCIRGYQVWFTFPVFWLLFWCSAMIIKQMPFLPYRCLRRSRPDGILLYKRLKNRGKHFWIGFQEIQDQPGLYSRVPGLPVSPQRSQQHPRVVRTGSNLGVFNAGTISVSYIITSQNLLLENMKRYASI